MPRTAIFLALLLLLLVGGAFFLSGRAREVPAQPVEIDVTNEAGAR